MADRTMADQVEQKAYLHRSFYIFWRNFGSANAVKYEWLLVVIEIVSWTELDIVQQELKIHSAFLPRKTETSTVRVLALKKVLRSINRWALHEYSTVTCQTSVNAWKTSFQIELPLFS